MKTIPRSNGGLPTGQMFLRDDLIFYSPEILCGHLGDIKGKFHLLVDSCSLSPPKSNTHKEI